MSNEKVPLTESARAVVRDGVLEIRVAVSTLPVAMKGACDLGVIDGNFRVTDETAFAREVARALNDEDEQGTTLVHRMFDAAFVAAIENGADGIEDEPGPAGPVPRSIPVTEGL